MSNNIAVTEGSGASIATDIAGGAHYQVIKLASGTEDSTARIGGDATNGLDVDVTRVIPGTAATNLGKAEDAAHSSGDTGVMILAVRQDSKSSLSGTDGDYTPLSVNSTGSLYVQVDNARDRLTDNMGVAVQTDVIMNDTTALTPKFASFRGNTSGDNTVVAAVVGKKIRVLSYVLSAAGALTARFEDGASGTALTGQMSMITGTPIVAPFNPVGYFETTANTLLNLELSAATFVDGHIVYVEV